MTYAFLALGVGLFVAALKLTGLPSTVMRVVADITATAAVLRSRSTTEAQKEAAARAAAIRMFGSLFLIVASLLFALALPIGLVVGASRLGILTVDEALRAGISWQAVIGATCLTVIILKVWR